MKPYPVTGNRYLVDPTPITASDIDIDRLLGLDREIPKPTEGNKINAIGPVYSEAWTESLIGCPILASAYSCTAKPCTTDIDLAASQFSIDSALKSDWSKIMDVVLERAVLAAQNRIAVRQLHLRGVIDMLAAYLGEEKLCLSLYDNTGSLECLLEKFTNLYIETVKRGFSLRKPWQGGYVSSWSLYAPGNLLDYQIDASNLFSAEMYEQYFLKFDEHIINNFDFTLVHIHACSIHVIESLLKLEHLKAIELSLDRETDQTDISVIIDIAKRIQSSGKALLIYGQLNETEFSMFTRQLNPNGFAIFYWR